MISDAQAQPGRVRLAGHISVQEGSTLPAVSLPATSGGSVDLAEQYQESALVLFFYPRDGAGLQFPELRGCTAEACSFRNRIQEINDLGARVFGISLQSTEWQQAFVQREHLPFALLSDADRKLVNALGIPLWVDESGTEYTSRVTLVVAKRGRIKRVFREVVVDRHVDEVVGVLEGLSAKE